MVLSLDVTVLWDMVDGPMPRGVLGVGDPDVHVIDGVPTMFLGGFSTSFRNRLYRAVLPEGADPASDRWDIERDDRGRVRALVADPPRDAWDGAGMHTPSYVPATSAQPARIYYTGRSSRKHYGPRSSYAIGAIELVDGEWRRRDAPLIEGVAPRTSVLEPLVVVEQGRYVMWFQANPHEIGPGELPDYELRVAESADGVTWSSPSVFASPEEGFFDNAVTPMGDGWLMVLARGSNLHNTPDFPAQGLWVSTARELSANRADWSEPVRVLDTDLPGTAAWMARGVYGPAILPSGDDELLVFATGVRNAPRWPAFNITRMLHGHKPVVPSPFYLATGSIKLRGMNDRAADRTQPEGAVQESAALHAVAVGAAGVGGTKTLKDGAVT